MSNTQLTPREIPNALHLIRPKELCEILSISIPTLYRWEAQGKLPMKKVKLGKGVCGYRLADVEKWLEEKTA